MTTKQHGQDALRLPLVERARVFSERTAIIDNDGKQHSYGDLLSHSGAVKQRILTEIAPGREDIDQVKVSLLFPWDYTFVTAQLATWRAGGVCVPLCHFHPPVELEYFIVNSESSAIVAHPMFKDVIAPIAEKLNVPLLFLSPDDAFTETTTDIDCAPASPPTLKPDDPDALKRNALIFYTSGSTGRPKGCVLTHSNLQHMVQGLVSSWGWTKDDHIINTLPLHHMHGLVNIVLSSLFSGAKCELHREFDSTRVWERLTGPSGVTLFMAVPTIYAKLLGKHATFTPEEQRRAKEGCARLRLMISGSMALPVPTMHQWEACSGHRLLERYGMTEIGMGLSNPLNGNRIPGFVGRPLPGIEVKIVPDDDDDDDKQEGKSRGGELRIKGPQIFQEYFNRPDATAEAFDEDGWFRTGDIAEACNEVDFVDDPSLADTTSPVYRILGRNSVDILKSGGYKLSALEIERALLSHPNIDEVAVIGLPDPVLGQIVTAVVKWKQPKEACSSKELRTWAADHLAPYEIPRQVVTTNALPVNAMGKVTKKKLAEEVSKGLAEQKQS